VIDRTNSMPLYAQVKQLLHEQILNGELSLGSSTLSRAQHKLSGGR
jgi:DNA-binding transcriptional regulator YhcF (GntR family)